MMRMVESISGLIEALGGASELARWAGYEDGRGVHNWISRGIPPGYHLRLTLHALAKGIVIAPDVFGLEGPEGDAMHALMSRAKKSAPRGEAAA